MRMCQYHIVVRWSTIADLSWDCSFKSLTIICNHSFLNVFFFFFWTPPKHTHTQKKSSGSGFLFALNPVYDPEKVCQIILACCVLHNICLNHGIEEKTKCAWTKMTTLPSQLTGTRTSLR